MNLGYLTQPRRDGAAAARGEGAELRSDQTVAIRGAQGVYISADAQLRACGRQLDREGLTGLADALASIQQQLADLATTHHADGTDARPLSTLITNLKQWEQGSNTQIAAGTAANSVGGQPIVAVDAPAGIVVGSGANIALGAQSHVDIVSIGNTQLSTGRKFLLRAAEAISLFSHKLGMKLIAAAGKIEVQTHQDDIELTSAKRIILSAAVEIVLQAPKVTIITEGAQANYGAGAVTHQCSSAYTVHSASFAHLGAVSASAPSTVPPTSHFQTDERFVLTRAGTGEALPNRRYSVVCTDDGSILSSGVSDAQGRTEISTAVAFKGVRIIVHPEDGAST